MEIGGHPIPQDREPAVKVAVHSPVSSAVSSVKEFH
jgi:hypothetical protein